MSSEPSATPPSAMRGPWKAFIAALMASPLAILLAGSTPSVRAQEPPKPAASSARPGAEALPECARRFLVPLAQFAGDLKQEGASAPLARPEAAPDKGHVDPKSRTQDVPVEPADWVGSATKIIAAQLDALGGGASADAFIATIPDPVDSGLDYGFDTTLQALRLGVEHGTTSSDPAYAPLFRDRSWLPWRDFDASGNARPESAQCRETTPGLMLFRQSTTSAPRLRALLLVGETPTHGVHVAAMVNALRVARAFGQETSLGDGPRPSFEIKIVGPIFSGGAFSLRLAIEKWAEQAERDADHEKARDKRHAVRTPLPALHIVTGSATGSSLVATLGSDSGWREGLRVSFDATTVPASAVECAYLHFVQRLESGFAFGKRPPAARTLLSEVAMLHESGTEFGASAAGAERAAGASEDDRNTTTPPLSCDLRAGVQISFPVHIASLREAYEELDRKETKSKDSIARSTSLEVSLREKHPPLDPQSNPSPRTTHAQDVALANILTQISVEKVRHVGIQATDIADGIFLARKIRDIAPDVRLAFFDSDALLLHPTFQNDLRGSLVVSPYAFLGTNHFDSRNTGGVRSYAPFENGAAEGTFNAVLAARGFPVTELLEYTAPSASPQDPRSFDPLPIWHSTIGRNGLVPLSMVRPLDCQQTIYRQGGSDLSTDLLAELCTPRPAAPTKRNDAKGSSEDDPAAQRAEEELKKRRAAAWTEFNIVSKLDLRSDVPRPRLWQFLFVFLLLAFSVDQYAL